MKLKSARFNSPIFAHPACALLLVFISLSGFAQKEDISTIAENGWANNSVNAVIFRKNSLVTYKGHQYASYYDADQFVVLAKRKLGSKNWETKKTQYKGEASDAHKSISIVVDGNGFLHLIWSQHNNKLNYAKSTAAGSLLMCDKLSMLSVKENKVSYPEFYPFKNGDLLFLYRDGGSGNGDMMINRYSLKTNMWTRVQDGLINGEGQRNAYWQVAIDEKGTIHLSWVWRETPDVASNHDMCYAKSVNGGKTWQKSTGEQYALPINARNAEYACKIPQKSELINQTSMFANAKGEVVIASYWRDKKDSIPQYHLVYKENSEWKVNNLAFRKTSFSLSGGGTKRIPISRPQIITWKDGKVQAAGLIFRDEERDNKVSIALTKNINGGDWAVLDITNFSVGDWEPTYDTTLWKKQSVLNLFIQNVKQIDGEGRANIAASPVQVLEWKPSY